MIIKILALIVLACLSAVAYRAGGSKDGRSWHRDWICPAFILAAILILRPAQHWYGWLMIIPAYGLIGGTLSTYWDPLTAIWRKDHVKRWENWLLHGLFSALGTLPLVYGGSIKVTSLIAYSVMVGVACSISSNLISNDVWEERARGAWFVLLAPAAML